MWWNQTNRNERLQPILSQSAFSQADLLTQLLAIADEASDLARAFYRKSHELEVVRKGDSTPLTDADTGLHHLIYERLEALFPKLPILSEESEVAQLEDRLKWPACWVVDPLDGTKEFLEKTDQFTINIALVIDGKAELGLISIPCRCEHWLGVVENGAAVFPEHEGLEGQVIQTSSRDSSRPLVMLASHRHSAKRVELLLNSLADRFGHTERVNSGSAVKFCDLLSGVADVYPRTSLCSEWDVAAGDALVRAAGGRVTDMNGRQIHYNRRPSLLAEPFVASADPVIDYAAVISKSL